MVWSAKAEVADLTAVAGIAAGADDLAFDDGAVAIGTCEQVYFVALGTHPAVVAALA